MLYRLTLDGIEWEESEHPRDGDGRFTAGARDWRSARDAALEKIRQDYKKPVEVPSGDGDPIIVSYAGLKHALNKAFLARTWSRFSWANRSNGPWGQRRKISGLPPQPARQNGP